MIRRLVMAFVVAALVGSCASGTEGTGDRATLPTVTPLVEGLAGPTQMAWHPDGRLLVAVLGPGGERAETGQILAIDVPESTSSGGLLTAPAIEVLVDGLDTPTGVTVAGGALWIMERTRLVTAPLAGGAVTVVRDDLPSNGRSNGALTTAPDGRVLYDTSAQRQGKNALEGSGVLWSLDPLDPTSPDIALLVGMKHAYATVADSAGGLLVTEIGDGFYDAKPALDEVVVIDAALPSGAPVDGGWPQCVSGRNPVIDYGGTPQRCERTVPSVTIFDAAATPTGIAIAPWDSQRAVVALWVTGEIVEFTIAPGGDVPDDAPVPWVTIVSGLTNPQDLLADDDRLLATIHGAGSIVAISR
jgi:glucose/arabinose dehydrogenase